ncbi:MAG: ATP-binding protein [Gemmatimonadaceae bacterium]
MIMSATRPLDAEQARLDALERYAVLDTPPEQAFDDLARLAALVCGTPMAQINFVDRARQWSKAAVGGPRGVMPRERGLCAHALERPHPLVVDDAVGDAGHLAGLALAYGEPTIRFYAGVRLVTPDGHAIGTLCVLDHHARGLSAEQSEALVTLSRQVLALLELRRQAPGRAPASRSPTDGYTRPEGDLRERDEVFRRLARVVSEGMGIMIAVDGCVVAANNAFGKLFGYESGEVIGLGLTEFIAWDAREATVPRPAASPERSHEARARRKDGSTFDVEVTARGITYQGYAAQGIVVRDISERKEIERLKNEFVSVVSHELRTPLTSIRGSLGLMEGGAAGELPPKARELIGIARQNADRLIRLINDILDLEKIEAGKIQLHIAALDPAALVERTVAELRAMALQYKVRVVPRMERRDAVAGDQDRVIQVLTNLVSNALKFSPEDAEVTISVGDGGPGFMRFTVIDRGPGISEDQRARLFGRFVQLDSTDRRRRGGTGLGLAISRSLVEQQSGRIGVDSAPGQGSSFWFELPLVAAPAATPAAGAAITSASGSAQHTVLVVEDEPAAARVLEIMLQRAGYAVAAVGSLADARRALESLHPSAVLLDVQLPDGSGLELAEELAARPTKIPVVVLSGRGPAADFVGAPVAVWLMKPFAKEQLLRAVKQVLATG